MTVERDFQWKKKPLPKPFAKPMDVNSVEPHQIKVWLSRAWHDFNRAKRLSLLLGGLFSMIPMGLLLVTYQMGHLVILPACVMIALIGPAFSHCFYDISSEIQRGKKPLLSHGITRLFQHATQSWWFVVFLVVTLIFWTRIAALIHALYPTVEPATLESLLPFLTLGTISGAALLTIVYCLTVFSPQILMDRDVHMITALYTSIHAVSENKKTMFLWACVLMTGVVFGFLTLGIGFILIMPLFSYASWHAYRDMVAY